MMPPFFAKHINGGSNCSSSSSDDDNIDTPIHKRIPLSSTLHQHDGDILSAAAMISSQQPTMKHSVSMLEMNDIQDMKQFGETMTALEVLQLSTTTSKEKKVNGDIDDGGGFFIDDSTSAAEEEVFDRSQNVSPDSVAAVIPSQVSGSEVKSGSSSSMMRRSMSMASLSSSLSPSQDKLDLLVMVSQQQMNDMHTIEEDEAKCIDSVKNEEKGDAKEIRRRGKRDKEDTRQRDINDELKYPGDAHECVVGETYDMPLVDHTTTARDCTNVKDDTRRRQVGSRRHDDKPLRSSLKKESSESLYNLDSSMKSTGSNKMRRNVSFGSLEIRSYPVTLGDAPTTNGPPVQLDWAHDPSATEEHNIDSYEMYRTDEEPRRSRCELFMPPMHRQYLLMREAGFTRGQIKMASVEAKRAAKQREKTSRRVVKGLQPYDEMIEKMNRRLSKLGRGGGGKK